MKNLIISILNLVIISMSYKLETVWLSVLVLVWACIWTGYVILELKIKKSGGNK